MIRKRLPPTPLTQAKIADTIKKYLDDGFPKQRDFVADRSQFIAAQCSRRAGKSNGLAIRYFHTMETHPKATCLYIALTRESAFNIMWPVLQEMNDKFHWGCKFLESKLVMIHPNGAKLRLLGADQKHFIKRLKGVKTPGVGIDEAQDFGSHLQSLVDDVLTPALADYEDSWLALTGTPGPVPLGYFYEATEEGKFGYSLHRWTILENPHLPKAKDFLAGLLKKRNWEESHPSYVREYLNRWVLDMEVLLIKYRPELNHYDNLPALPPRATWHYITGVDLGLKDADSLGTIAWSEGDPNIYLVDELLETDNGITELAESLHANIAKYHPDKLPTDEGALGKKIAEEIRRRHHIPLQPADKKRKMENVALLNDWLKQGKFKAKKDSHFAQDSYRLQIDWERSKPDKIVLKSGFHSDIIDAVLYAFKESPAYTYVAAQKEHPYGSKEWAKKEQERMFQEAQEHFEEQAELMAREKEDGWGQ